MGREKMSPCTELTINSFFAGIGGFDIGFENSGFKTSFLCEINPFCNDVLTAHWPNVKRATDICKVNPLEIPDATVWCGGFPCQDISVARGASERLGLHGQRSGLFYQYADLIELKHPEVVILENVAGLFNSNGGRDFGVILQRMMSMGYAVAWRLVNSRYFGVPQSRTRVYICCWKANPMKAMLSLFDRNNAPLPNERKAFVTPSATGREYPIVPQVAYCLAATSGRHTGTDWSRTYVVCKDGVRRMTPVEYERLQGFPDDWTTAGSTSLGVDEIDTLRYTAIGNAVSVPVVEWLAKRIKEVLPLQIRTLKYKNEIKSYVSQFSKEDWHATGFENINFGDTSVHYTWPNSGIAYKGSYIGAKVPPTPHVIIDSLLGDIVETEGVSRRYYLTPNAAEGILRRVDHQKRTLFAPLRAALEKEKNKQQ